MKQKSILSNGATREKLEVRVLSDDVPTHKERGYELHMSH